VPGSTRERPYTSLSPTHVVMISSPKAGHPKGNWVEILYHEASHHLIFGRSGFVGGTINDVAGILKKRPLRSLWHAYLFYFSGVVTRDALRKQGIKDYQLYMIRNRVFSFYFPYLEKHLPSYINRKTTLKDATEAIFRDFEALRAAQE